MKAYLDTSVNLKPVDDDITDLIFDMNIYRRSGPQVSSLSDSERFHHN